MSKAVSILIPTHNRCEILGRTLESLQVLEVPPGVEVEAIVVNNLSTDRTDEVVNGWLARSKVPLRLVHEQNIGLNNARNRAIREARFDLLAFLDDDVLVDPGWLVGLLRSFDESGAGMIGGRVRLWWEEVQRPGWMIPELEDHLSALDLGEELKPMAEARVVGANFALTRAAFNDAGEFRPDLDRKGKSLLSGGETDFILRAMARGHRLFYSPWPSLRHWVPAHRAQLPHLLKIIEGKSVTNILMRKPYGPAGAARSLAGGLGKVARHAPASLGLLSGGRLSPAAIRARMRCAVGRGQVLGVMRRWGLGGKA